MIKHLSVLAVMASVSVAACSNPAEPEAAEAQQINTPHQSYVVPPLPTCPVGYRPYMIVAFKPTPHIIAWVCGRA